MQSFVALVVITWAATLSSAEQYRVLILGPVASRSEYHLCSSLAEALGEAGHHVTFVSSFKLKYSSKYAVQHVLTGDKNMMDEMDLFELNENPNKVYTRFVEAFQSIGSQMWSNEEIKQLWRKRNTFHAIIIISFLNAVATPFLWEYQGVYISLCLPGFDIESFSNQGNWLPFSTVPGLITSFTQNMSFLERALNPLYFYFYVIQNKFTMLAMAESIVQEFFPGMPSVTTFYQNNSLTLINGHFSIDGQVPLLPTQVEIGTINAKRPEPLPQDLDEFLEGAGEAGVILFSLGTIARSTHMPTKYKDVILEAFSRLPQRVVWKYEGDDLHLPPNVMVKAWVPQQDMLGHNMTRLFISHCGNLGLQEAQYHGVPILGLPLAFDQLRNANRMSKNGYGLALQWKELTVETLLETIHTLLNTPRFREKLQAVSRALQDQKDSPKERATWWVEYAIRHKDAPHMTYAGKRLHYLQYIMADVVVFWLAVLVTWLVLSVLCVRRVIRYCSKPHKHIFQETKKYK